MSTKGTAAYKEDEEMSMEEILASIRKYVTDEDSYGVAKAAEPFSLNEAALPSMRHDVLELSELKNNRVSPALEEDFSVPSTAPLGDVYAKSAEDQEPFGGATMAHSYANQSPVQGYGHPPQGPSQPSYSSPSAMAHSPFGVATAPIYPHQVYGQTPQLHPVTPDTLMQAHQPVSADAYGTPQPMMQTSQQPLNPYAVPQQGMTTHAASASGQSLSKLIEAAKITQAHMEKAAAAAASSHSLENIALHAMAPQIKAWLDEHLPAVVERLVQKEIERLTKTLLKV